MNTLPSIYDQAKADVDKELVSQLNRWGFPNHSPEKWLVILSEEVGEVARAILSSNMRNFREELIQVAAVALSAVAELDDQER